MKLLVDISFQLKVSKLAPELKLLGIAVREGDGGMVADIIVVSEERRVMSARKIESSRECAWNAPFTPPNKTLRTAPKKEKEMHDLTLYLYRTV
jgi:hypothetical protein